MTEHSLYRLYDSDDNLLYVGVAVNLTRRVADHRRKPWGHEYTRWTAEQYPDKATAEAAERAAIQSENPRYNVSFSNVNRPTYGKDSGDGDLLSREEVAERFGIAPESVRSFLARYGVRELRGYPRAAVDTVRPVGQGRRTDLNNKGSR